MFEPVLLMPGAGERAFDARPVPAGGEVARERQGPDARVPRLSCSRAASGSRRPASGAPSTTTRWRRLALRARADRALGHARLPRPPAAALAAVDPRRTWCRTTAGRSCCSRSRSSWCCCRCRSRRSSRCARCRSCRRRCRRSASAGGRSCATSRGEFNAEAQRQMNEEVMGLYRQEGVNPAGGCLPMLVQLPIFLAFYNMLSTAVELKWAPWALWIKDLAEPDPYFVLPIVMGATQLIQQRMTPPPPDPVPEADDAVPAGRLHRLLARLPERPGALLADEQRSDHRSADGLQPDQGPVGGGRRGGGSDAPAKGRKGS